MVIKKEEITSDIKKQGFCMREQGEWGVLHFKKIHMKNLYEMMESYFEEKREGEAWVDGRSKFANLMCKLILIRYGNDIEKALISPELKEARKYFEAYVRNVYELINNDPQEGIPLFVIYDIRNSEYGEESDDQERLEDAYMLASKMFGTKLMR